MIFNVMLMRFDVVLFVMLYLILILFDLMSVLFDVMLMLFDAVMVLCWWYVDVFWRYVPVSLMPFDMICYWHDKFISRPSPKVYLKVYPEVYPEVYPKVCSWGILVPFDMRSMLFHVMLAWFDYLLDYFDVILMVCNGSLALRWY